MPFGRRIHLASYFEDFVFIIDVDVSLLLLLFTQREREKEPSAHQRDTKRTHKHTNTHTDRQSVIKRANKKARFMLPSKTTTKAREHYFSTSFARPRQLLATSSAIRWRSLARTTVFYSHLLVLLLHRHQTMREEDFDDIPSSSSM